MRLIVLVSMIGSHCKVAAEMKSQTRLGRPLLEAPTLREDLACLNTAHSVLKYQRSWQKLFGFPIPRICQKYGGI